MQPSNSLHVIVPAAQPEASLASWLRFYLGKHKRGWLCWANRPTGALFLQMGQGVSQVWVPGLCVPSDGVPGACLQDQ